MHPPMNDPMNRSCGSGRLVYGRATNIYNRLLLLKIIGETYYENPASPLLGCSGGVWRRDQGGRATASFAAVRVGRPQGAGADAGPAALRPFHPGQPAASS